MLFYISLSYKWLLRRVTLSPQVSGRKVGVVQLWWSDLARTRCTRPTSRCDSATTSTRAGTLCGCSCVGVFYVSVLLHGVFC